MALFLGAHVHDLRRVGSLSTAALANWVTVLGLYVSSVVVGRLYTGMYRISDVFVGIILGITRWVLQRFVMLQVERWATNSGWSRTSFMSGTTANPYSYISSQPPPCPPTSVVC